MAQQDKEDYKKFAQAYQFISDMFEQIGTAVDDFHERVRETDIYKKHIPTVSEHVQQVTKRGGEQKDK